MMLRTKLLGFLGLLITVAYLAGSMQTSFIAHDEGLLGQTAERTLAGETPHVDFDDPYTGGLTYLNALSFRLLGSRSSSLRVALLVFSTIFVICYYLVAKRLVGPIAATAVAMGAIVWSLKNYFAALPSWYNLFFAVFGVLALFLDVERRDARRFSPALFFAGVMGGLSIIIKITGLYFVAAGLLYVLFDAQKDAQKDADEAASDPGPQRPRHQRLHIGLADLCAWLAPPVTLLLLLGLLARRLEAMDVLQFLLPATLVATLPWIAMRRRPEDQGPPSDRRFLARSLQFLLGVALPPVVFSGALVVQHGSAALAALYRGVFELPRLRVGSADFSLPPLSSLLIAAPLLVLCIPGVQRRLRGWPAMTLVGLGLGALLLLAGRSAAVYQAIWAPLRSLIPFFIALAAIVLIRSPDGSAGSPAGRRLFVLAATTAFLSLGQFPYSSGLYFAYTAPALALLIVAVWRGHPDGRRMQLLLSTFVVLFALVYLNGSDPRSLGYRHQPLTDLELLAPERVNLLVPAVQRRGYEAIAEIVRTRISPSRGIWAGPDAPEIYFLTGRTNRTRHLYEFVDPEWEAQALELTADADVGLIVINRQPEFTEPMSDATSDQLVRRFPEGIRIGPMEVRWRP